MNLKFLYLINIYGGKVQIFLICSQVKSFLKKWQGSDTKELTAASRLHADINFYQTDNVDVARLFRIDPQIKPPALVMLKWEAANRSHVGFG
jgi:protein disulfide-isomerase A1